jgi:hypothetical protein
VTSPRDDARRARTAAAAILVAALAAGACGRSPVDGAAGGDTSRSGCAPGVTPLVARTLGQSGLTGLAWHDGAVVVTELDDVMSFPADGSPSTTVAHMSETSGLVVTGTTAYFEASIPAGAPDAQGKVSSTSGLFSVPFAGGDPTLVLGEFFITDSAVTDGTAVYLDATPTGVVRLSVADGARTNLAVPPGLQIDAMAIHAGALYVAAIDLRSTSATNGLIVKVSTSTTGGAPETLLENIGHPWNLVADASGIYWAEEPPVGQFGDSHIRHAGLDGKGATTLLQHGAVSLALSEGDLYIANAGGISKLPKGGGGEVPLITGLRDPGRLVVADRNAAWVDPASQALSDPTVPSIMTTCW